MMKVLFLDIDGVVAPTNDPNKKVQIRDGLSIPYSWNLECCARINSIIEKTNCEIVLTSDWRRNHSLQEMRDIFNYHNIPGDRLIGFTNHSKEYKYGSLGYGRSIEISEWLALHRIQEWCAVDDLNLTAIDASKFVKTRPDKGIDEEDVEKVIEILGE